MEKQEIEVNGKKIKVAVKLSKEEIEDNNIKIYLEDTKDLTEVIKEIKKDESNE